MRDQRTLNRRRFLRRGVGVGALGTSAVLGATSGTAVQSQGEPGELEWAADLMEGSLYRGRRSSPTVVDGTVYVGGVNSQVSAFDASTGDQEWVADPSGLVNSTPNVVDGTVYIGCWGQSSGQHVYAFDAATGDQKWAFPNGGNVQSSPTVVDGTVYVGAGDGNVYALDAATGDQEWAFSTGSYVSGSPTIVDNTVYIGSDDNTVYALDAATGDQAWAVPTGDSIASSPTVADGTVYIGSSDGNVYALDAATGAQTWTFPTADAVISSPTVIDGTVYIGSGDSNLYALDAATGDREWAIATGDAVNSSPTVVDGTVYFGSRDGNVYAVDVATTDHEWTFQTGDRGVGTALTVVNGVVYVTSQNDTLFAINAGKSGSSTDSRVVLGTLSHHHAWAHRDTAFDQRKEAKRALAAEIDQTSITLSEAEPIAEFLTELTSYVEDGAIPRNTAESVVRRHLWGERLVQQTNTGLGPGTYSEETDYHLHYRLARTGIELGIKLLALPKLLAKKAVAHFTDSDLILTLIDELSGVVEEAVDRGLDLFFSTTAPETDDPNPRFEAKRLAEAETDNIVSELNPDVSVSYDRLLGLINDAIDTIAIPVAELTRLVDETIWFRPNLLALRATLDADTVAADGLPGSTDAANTQFNETTQTISERLEIAEGAMDSVDSALFEDDDGIFAALVEVWTDRDLAAFADFLRSLINFIWELIDTLRNLSNLIIGTGARLSLLTAMATGTDGIGNGRDNVLPEWGE